MSRLCFCRLMVTTNFAHDYFIYILFWNDEVFFRCFRHSFSWKEEELQETKGAISFMLTMESGIKIAHFGVVKYCTSLVLFFSLCTASTFITQRTWQKKKQEKMLSSNYAIQWRNPIYSKEKPNNRQMFICRLTKMLLNDVWEFPRHSFAVG